MSESTATPELPERKRRRLAPEALALREAERRRLEDEAMAKLGQTRPEPEKPPAKKPKNGLKRTRRSDTVGIDLLSMDLSEEQVNELLTRGAPIPSGLEPRLETSVVEQVLPDDHEVATAKPPKKEPAAREDRPRNIEDLFSQYPVGDTKHYCTVERVKPATSNGMPCAGMQRPIKDSLGKAGSLMTKFTERYGGGEYVLRVYGPPPSGRGAIDPDTGEVRPRALSPDLRVVVPFTAPFGVAPIPQPDIDDDELDDNQDDGEDYEDMDTDELRIPRVRLRTGATVADAKIHEATLSHADRTEERRARRAREEAAAVSQLPNAVAPLLDRAAEQADKTVERILSNNREKEAFLAEEARRNRERLDELEERRARESEERLRQAQEELERRKAEIEAQAAEQRLQRERERNPTTEALAALTPLLSAFTNNSRGSDGVAESYRLQLEASQRDAQRRDEANERERTRLVDQYNQERTRLIEQHAQELRREREGFERQLEAKEKAFELAIRSERDRIATIEQRAERQIRDAEERAERRVREADDLIERRTREVRESAERQIADINRIHELARATDEKNHERELRAVKESLTGQVQIKEAMSQQEINALQRDLARQEAEAERLREEAASRPDPLEAMTELKEKAAALGMKEGNAAPDFQWGPALLGMAPTLMQAIPDAIEKFTALRRPAAPAAPQLPPAQHPAMGQLPAGPMVPQLPAPPGRRRLPPPPQQFAVEGARVQFQPVPEQYQSVSAALPQQPMMAPPPPPYRPAPAPVVSPQSILPPPPPRPEQYAPNPAQPQDGAEQLAPPPAPAEGLGLEASAEPGNLAGMFTDENILGMRSMFESAYEGGGSPSMFAADLRNMMPGGMLQQVAGALSVDRITSALLTAEDGATSPLMRAPGQKWLAEVLEEAKK